MPTTTRQRSQSSARFGRPAARPSSPRVKVGKRQPQPSGVGKLLQGMARKSGASRGKSRRGSGAAKGSAGAALLFSAAGLAFKNRGKLTSMLSRKNKDATPRP